MHTFKVIFLQTLLISAVALLGLLSSSGMAQNCQCNTEIYCCSKYGYCGTGYDYCGPGCQKGPCDNKPCEGDGTLTVSDIVTQEFFDRIASQASSSCPGKGFYTRSAFLSAASAYPEFGTTCTDDVRKREIAAYFAHVTHETGHLCYIEEINKGTYCDPGQYPCNPAKKYFGRGPLQLSWNYNYIPAGQKIGFDGLNDPDKVARDSVVSFKSSLWFWMKRSVHSTITSNQGFGATIKLINGIECNGGNTVQMMARVNYYKAYCAELGVSPGDNLTC